eukprot:3077187-Lingulodinium_polyedra.AAC.1
MADGLMALGEAKCSGSGGMDMAKAYNIQSAVTLIRLQMFAARARREEVCDLIRSTGCPKVTRCCRKEPDMVLTDGE